MIGPSKTNPHRAGLDGSSAEDQPPRLRFSIDVGGTFTDCLGSSPSGDFPPLKLLSSGIIKGSTEQWLAPHQLIDSRRTTDPPRFWIGYQIGFFDNAGQPIHSATITDFDSDIGTLTFDIPTTQSLPSGMPYEISSGEEAPIVAIRYLLGIPLHETIPPVSVRLGTTRGTNALLTRRGAKVAFVTTRGFGDVLKIAYQDRPRLFDLAIKKPQPLFARIVEIDARMTADGQILQPPDEATIRQQLTELRSTNIESLAICLLHSFAHPQHEQMIERIAREVGFTEISTSHRLAPLIKIVARGDTTVVDAYLNPILREYVAALRHSLPGSDLKIMTSAGGLVDADHFVGKDSILSGPAGGVIGFSRVAERAGFKKSIGFDMGGTSTDVARFDGHYQREYETQKAGVRIVAPMLAIETVAAGGGSICDFDGVKLIVGPDSAGADPGPACYGRGGPLTVTDINLHLGRLLPAQFPFALDAKIVATKLQHMSERIAEATGEPLMRTQRLAGGFLKIAVANMVRAIRNISVAKGYDPGEHALVTFGGAGGGHACAIARELGIANILIHPFAGILSAYGIGLGDVNRFAQESVLKPLSPATLTELEPVFKRMETATIAEVVGQGIPTDQIEAPLRSLDLRYQGAEATLNLLRPDDENWTAEFEEQHKRLFGFLRSGKPIEIAAARVEVVGKTRETVTPLQTVVDRQPAADSTTPIWFDDVEAAATATSEDSRSTSLAPRNVNVYFRSAIRAGDRLSGPCIVCEPTSTVVIDPGFDARVLAGGEILITASEATSSGAKHGSALRLSSTNFASTNSTSTDPDSANTIPHPSITTATADPVLLEIFNNAFASVADQMGITLQRTAFSTNVKERRDFSCAIFSADGNLVANAPHVPVHLGAMSETVKCMLSDHPEMKAGDVFVTNDPYRGGSHLPDITVVTPVHDATTGQLLFFTASRAHHAEIGSIVPGSFPPFSKNLAEEGVLIRDVTLFDGGRSNEDELIELLSTARYPSRRVDENMADIAAQVAANNGGASLLQAMVERHTLPIVQQYMTQIQAAAARKMRAALLAIPDGVYRMTDHLDDGSPISVAITISGSEASVDFSGTGTVLPGNLNANRSIVTAAVLYVFRCLINEDIPLNGGVLEPIEIILPTCLLNPPTHDDPRKCAAVVGGNVETSSRVVDVLLGALKVAAASQGTMNNLTFGDDSFGYYETICGGSGATADADGADAVHTHMTNTRLTDPEIIEHRYPVRVLEFAIRRGSGGAGKQRGGDGIIRRFEFLRELTVSLLTERRGPYPPFGLSGGQPGALGKNTLLRCEKSDSETLPAKTQIDVQPGDILTIETPGGGGYGVPCKESVRIPK